MNARTEKPWALNVECWLLNVFWIRGEGQGEAASSVPKTFILQINCIVSALAAFILFLLSISQVCARENLASLVADRTAVERIYYDHRLGTKPPFDQVLPAATLTNLVKSDFKKEAVLRKAYGLEITPAMVDAEVRRINANIYARVRELSLGIVNASGDEALRLSLVQQLRAYFDELMSIGRPHPFLTEAVAAFTDTPAEAMKFYRLALAQIQLFPDEPKHTMMIGLAEQLILLGQREQAEAFLRDGGAEAARIGDSFFVQEAERMLQGLRLRRDLATFFWLNKCYS